MIKEKILAPKQHLKVDDLTPNQKKQLWDLMIKHGATQGFAYDRFFKEGFREWELRGINQIKQDFIKLHERELWTEPDEYGDIGYTGVLTMQDDGEFKFYDVIGRVRGLRKAFIIYMSELGMGSNTVVGRFGKAAEEDFKDFERVGIRAIIEEFDEMLEKQDDGTVG